jgi:hypothetical protein
MNEPDRLVQGNLHSKLCVCGDILNLPPFSADPPTFATLCPRVIRWLDFILGYIEKSHLEAARQREANRPKKKDKAAIK